MDKKIRNILFICIFIVLIVGITSFILLNNHNNSNNETIVNNVSDTNITNITEDNPTTSNSGKYGHCAICGASLSYAEANDEYTQGKVCRSCAINPYYQTDPGAAYANQKLEEAYPEQYNGIADDSDYQYS